jgi:hypothetical protein
MPSKTEWIGRAEKALVGRKITGVRWLSTKEIEALGWHHSAVVLQLDDGTILWPSRDDEGDGAGALFGQGGDGTEQTWPRGV